MIQAIKNIFIDPVQGADPIVDTDIVHTKQLTITITQDDEHFQLFETLLKALKVKIEQKITSEEA